MSVTCGNFCLGVVGVVVEVVDFFFLEEEEVKSCEKLVTLSSSSNDAKLIGGNAVLLD